MDDEYHFVLECSLLRNLRSELIPNYYWKRPSMSKLLELLNNSNIQIINNLAKYSKKGFALRQRQLT